MKKTILLLFTLTMTIFIFSTEIFYTVGFEDTLYSISRKLNIPLNNLINENNLNEPYLIEPGQKLKITEYSDEDFQFITDKIEDKNEIIELFFNHFYKIAHHNFDYEIRERFMYNLTKLLYENDYKVVADNTINLIVDNKFKEKVLLLKAMSEIKSNNVHILLKLLNGIEDKDIKRNLEYTLSDLLIKAGYAELGIDFRRNVANESADKIFLEDSNYKNNHYYLIKNLLKNGEYRNSLEIFSNYILTENISTEKLLTTMDIFILLLNNEKITETYKEDLNNLFIVSWLMI